MKISAKKIIYTIFSITITISVFWYLLSKVALRDVITLLKEANLNYVFTHRLPVQHGVETGDFIDLVGRQIKDLCNLSDYFARKKTDFLLCQLQRGN